MLSPMNQIGSFAATAGWSGLDGGVLSAVSEGGDGKIHPGTATPSGTLGT